MKTDNSSRFVATTEEEYLKMGRDHTKKDKKIGRWEICMLEKTLNSHAVCWCKIWNSGENHGHMPRIIASKTSISNNEADMYCLYKDHKAEPGKSRPVVTGCNSNTRGFSNSVSDLLESVNKANTTPYEAISSEDMLAKITRYNKKAEEIMQEGRAHLQKKVLCSRGKGMRLISRCDKLWLKLRNEMEVGNDNQEEPSQDLQEGCGREIDEATLSYRRSKYEGYQNLAGEDFQIVLD